MRGLIFRWNYTQNRELNHKAKIFHAFGYYTAKSIVSINNFRQEEVTAQKTLHQSQVKMAGERGTVNAIMDIVKHYWGAYGMGVEYALHVGAWSGGICLSGIRHPRRCCRTQVAARVCISINDDVEGS